MTEHSKRRALETLSDDPSAASREDLATIARLFERSGTRLDVLDRLTTAVCRGHDDLTGLTESLDSLLAAGAADSAPSGLASGEEVPDATGRDEGVRLGAVGLLGAVACLCPDDLAHEVEPILRDVAETAGEEVVKHRVVVALGRLASVTAVDDASVEILVDSLEGADPSVASVAAVGVGASAGRFSAGPDGQGGADDGLVERLVGALDHDDPWVRVGALRGLAIAGEKAPGVLSAHGETVLDRVDDDHPGVRSEAIAAADQLATADVGDHRDVIAALDRRIGESLDRTEARRVVVALETVGDDVDSTVAALTLCLDRGSTALRSAAAGSLAAIAAEAPSTVETVVDTLAERALEDPDEPVRSEATAALGHLSEEYSEAVRDVVDRTADALVRGESPSARRAGALLGEAGGQAVLADTVDHLVDALSGNGPPAVEDARRALVEIGRRDPSLFADAADPLVGALSGDGPIPPTEAARVVGAIGSENPSLVAHGVDPLVAALTGESALPPRVAATALGEVGNRDPSLVADALDPLVAALTGEDSRVAGKPFPKTAAEVIGKIGDGDPSLVADAVGPLVDAFDHDDLAVRRRAPGAVGRIGRRDPSLVAAAVGPLVAALSGGERIDRDAAAGAIEAIAAGDPSLVVDAVEPLLAAVDRTVPESDAHGRVVLALEAIVTNAPPDVRERVPRRELRSALRAVTADPDEPESARVAAATALSSLGIDPVVHARELLSGPESTEATSRALETTARTAPTWVRPLASDLDWVRERGETERQRQAGRGALEALGEKRGPTGACGGTTRPDRDEKS